MSDTRLLIVSCRNPSSSLRYILGLYLIEATPLTFIGHLPKRTVDYLIKSISEISDGSLWTIVFSDNSSETGIRILTNDDNNGRFVKIVDGLQVSVRRHAEMRPWQKILGKTIPSRYPLILHLLDTAAVSKNLWNSLLSEKQRRQIADGLGVSQDEALSIVMYLAGMHDIGKASPFWQQSTLKITKNDESIHGLDFPEIGSNIVKHDVQGYLYAAYQRITHPNVDVELYELLKTTSLGHHGNFKSSSPDLYGIIKTLDDSKPIWFDEQKYIEFCVRQTINFTPVEIKENACSNKILINLIEGIIILSDWIASQSSFINDLPYDTVYGSHFLEADAKALKFVDDNGLKAPVWKSKDLGWLDINSHITQPNDMQQKIVENIDENTGFVFISAPMGNGKTEAAVYAASKMGAYANNSGIYFSLPTQATSDAMFERLVSNDTPLGGKIFTGGYSVSLMHSNSLVARFLDRISKKSGSPTPPVAFADNAQIDDEVSATNNFETDSIQYISDFLISRKLGGMSALSVGTIDSLLDTTIPLKHNALRWLSVSGKTIVIDEAHSFDSYTTELIRNFVSWCAEFNVPVICMTATMPEEEQKALCEAYIKGLFTNSTIPKSERRRRKNKSIEELDELFEKSPIKSPGVLTISNIGKSKIIDCISSNNTPDVPMLLEIENTGVKEKELSEAMGNIIVEHINNNKNSRIMRLVIANTVGNAIALFDRIKTTGVECDLLHSKMPPLMKQRIVKKILDKTGKNSDRLNSDQYVLVSTQIVESSLDIDFDEIHTQIAPVDSILQRLGRVYRHNNKRSAQSVPKAYFYVSEDLNELTETGVEKASRSFLPYSDWEMASSLYVIKQLIEKQNPIRIKSSIDTIFHMVNNQCRMKYPNFFDDFNNECENKSGIAKESLVRFSSDLINMTSLATAKSSRRAPVRLILGNTLIIPFKKGKIVSEVQGREKLVSPPVFSYKDLKTYRLYADNAFSVYDWDFEKLDTASKNKEIEELEKELNMPEYIRIVFVDDDIYSVGDKGLGLDMRGLDK